MRIFFCSCDRQVAVGRRPLAALIALLLLCAISAQAATPRPAPDFTFEGVGGKKSLRSLRGQPVVLVIAKSPKTKAFRKETESLEEIYHEFAGKGVVFVAAFSEAEGEVKSNIPFVLANNAGSVASAYDLRKDIVVAVIGKDGNLDLITGQMVPAWRIREVIANNFETQNLARKEQPKGPPAVAPAPATPLAPGVEPDITPSARPKKP